MPIYLDDRMPTHPKFMRAAQLLGPPEGHARAFLLYVLGLGYARQYLTNGHIPVTFPQGVGLISAPENVVKALCDPRVKLWRKVDDGYEIHDYLDWNVRASVIKEKRRLDRDRKRAERQRN